MGHIEHSCDAELLEGNIQCIINIYYMYFNSRDIFIHLQNLMRLVIISKCVCVCVCVWLQDVASRRLMDDLVEAFKTHYSTFAQEGFVSGWGTGWE